MITEEKDSQRRPGDQLFVKTCRQEKSAGTRWGRGPWMGPGAMAADRVRWRNLLAAVLATVVLAVIN